MITEITVDILLSCFCFCSSAPHFLTNVLSEYVMTDDSVSKMKVVKIIIDTVSKYLSTFLSRFNDLIAR